MTLQEQLGNAIEELNKSREVSDWWGVQACARMVEHLARSLDLEQKQSEDGVVRNSEVSHSHADNQKT